MKLTLCVVTFGAVAILFCNVEASAYDANTYNGAERFTEYGHQSCSVQRNEIEAQHLPSMAIVYKDSDVACIGTIINPQWILTAAHYVLLEQKRRYTVKTGTKYIDGFGTISNVAKIVYHENYNNVTRVNDYVLLGLECDIFLDTCNTNAAILPLQFDQRFTVIDRVTVYGFGLKDETKGRELHKALFHISPRAECAYWCGLTEMPADQFCLISGADIDTINSGAPAIAAGYLLGVAQMTCMDNRNDRVMASVFGTITYVRDWIDSAINYHTPQLG